MAASPSTFFELAAKLWEDGDRVRAERLARTTVAEGLAKARAMHAAGDIAWATTAAAAIDTDDCDVIEARDRTRLGAWLLTADSDAAVGETVGLIWDAEVREERAVDAFAGALSAKVTRTRTARLDIASTLIGALGVDRHPPMRLSIAQRSWNLLRYRSVHAKATEGAYYAQGLRNLDRLTNDALDAGLELADRLDAQIAVWLTFHLPLDDAAFTSWSDSDRDRLARVRA